HWKRVADLPVVTVRYQPHSERDDVQLEQVQIRDGEIRLEGRSNRAKGIVGALTLPTRKVLQSKFPRRKVQEKVSPIDPMTSLRSSALPTSWRPSRRTRTWSGFQRIVS